MWRRLLLALTLLSGCALIDHAAVVTDRAFSKLIGDDPKTTLPHDPIYIDLQLTMLSDSVVNQIVKLTDAPLDAARTQNERELVLRMRLDYAAALWSAASGPIPQANAIDMFVTLDVAQKSLPDSAVASLLGPRLQPILDMLAAAQRDTARVLQTFLEPAEYQTLQRAIATQEDVKLDARGLSSIDLESLLGSAPGQGPAKKSLLGVLGMDPFAGLDPATREIAESRQLGERLLFNIQRLPFLIRLNAELLANAVSSEIGLPDAIAGIQRASDALSQVARTSAALPGEIDQQRVKIFADIRNQADQLNSLAREYRSAFEAASVAVVSTNQALQTFDGVLTRLSPDPAAEANPGPPFDITQYTQTATAIDQAALSLSGLLGEMDQTLDSPALTRLTPQLAMALDQATQRSRSLLYTAFALGCALILLISLAVILTAAVLRRQRRSEGSALRSPP